MTKQDLAQQAPKTPQTTTTTPEQKPPDSALAIVSMVLGVTSLTGPGFLFGIPAIITASIALKKSENNRGLSITGLVTGIISTVVSLLFVTIIILAIIWTYNHPESMRDTDAGPHPGQVEQMFDGSEI